MDLGGGSVYAPKTGAPKREVVFTVVGIIKGKDLKNSVPTVAVLLSSQTEDWVYLKTTNTFRVILDGKDRLLVGVMKRGNSEVLLDGGGVLEQLNLEVLFALIERFSRAAKLEMQIGLEEFELKPAQIADLKEWVSRFPAALSK